MSNYQNNFRRYEKKYILNEEEYRGLISLIYYKLQYDNYRKYKICNIYFDTPNFDLIRESIDKPVYKEKLRLRSYGTPENNDEVFLEIKKKYDGVVYKRRISLPYENAINYCINGKELNGSSQIVNEIKWFMTRYNLYPMVYLSYDRVAMKAIEDENLRITFDTNVKWRANNLDLSAGDFGEIQLETGTYIMEIKTPTAMPLWLSEALNSLKIYPKSYSKYGNVYKDNILKGIASNLGGHQSDRKYIDNNRRIG